MNPPTLRQVRQYCHSFGLHQVYFDGNNLSVTVTKRAAEVDDWVKETVYTHRPSLPQTVNNVFVGLDIEWEHNQAATLQLCVGERCLIFLLLHKDYIPYSLLAFLEDSYFTFVGVGVGDDADKLLRYHGLEVRKFLDLRLLNAVVYGSEQQFVRMGLKKMALQFLGRVMEKPQPMLLFPLNWVLICLLCLTLPYISSLV